MRHLFSSDVFQFCNPKLRGLHIKSVKNGYLWNFWLLSLSSSTDLVGEIKEHAMSRKAIKKEVEIQSNALTLIGDLVIPDRPQGLILFAHGSGSSRHSARNRYVAERLNRSGFATLLLDLLTSQEEREEEYSMHFRFDIDMLATRLCAAVDWLCQNEETKKLAIGLFGASTGSAAALACAAKRRANISAVVSRGGRPDLAADALPYVLCPTLFLVGGFDPEVMAMNEKSLHSMNCYREIEIIPGASHLFEEPGRLEQVATLATWWFARYCSMSFAPRVKSTERKDRMSASMVELANGVGHIKPVHRYGDSSHQMGR